MMGNIRPADSPVTKTTNAVIVLAQDHPLIQKKRQNPAIGLRRAASSCCQCETCTDLCPRHGAGDIQSSLTNSCGLRPTGISGMPTRS